MKKVLFVATVVKTHIMTFHLPYLQWFKENGYETHVCARNDYEDKQDCVIPFCDRYYDIPFDRSPFKLSNLNAYKMLKTIIENNNYDIIHCHTPVGAALTRLAARNFRKKGTRVIYTAHGFHFYRGAPFLNWLLYYPVERFLARYTDLLVTINKEDYARARKFPAREVAYVPGVGIDTNKFRIDNFDRQKKRRELGIPDECFVILSVGELNKNKNHEVVIRALASMDMTNVRYLICGRGELEGYLRRLAGELGVGDKVRLLGFRTDMPEIYRAADVFVFPSFREGLPVALMEAMAAGLPVVCSSIRGNTDLVKDGENGYLVNPTDTDGFARYMAEVLNDGELRRTMGVKSVQLVQPFGTARVMHRMSNLYRTE